MALPTLDKTWFFNVNNKRATAANLSWHQNLMFALKNILINNSPAIAWTNAAGSPAAPAGIWTVDHSCDSTTAGTPADGVDRWVTAGNLVWDRPIDPHSWIVFNTGINGGSGQVLIDLDNNNSSSVNSVPESIRVSISPGGLYTGGTTTAAPTASDEVTELTRGTTAGWWAGGQTGTGVDSAFHVLMSSDGAEMRIFMYRTNVCYSIWVIGEAKNLPSGVAANAYGSIWSTTQNTPEEAGETHDQNNGWLHGNFNNARAQSGNLCKIVYLNYPSSSGNQSLWANSIIPGIGDEVSDETVFGELSMWDTDSAGARGPKGTMQDIWVVTNARANGDTFPADGSRQFHKVAANVAVPWNGSIPENTF